MGGKAYELCFDQIGNEFFSASCALVPWDSELFGFSVAELQHLTLLQPVRNRVRLQAMEHYLTTHQIKLCCAKVPLQSVAEYTALQLLGFRFILISYHLQHADLSRFIATDRVVPLVQATASDREQLIAIAGQSFVHERYYLDPQLDPALSNKRYQHWLLTSLANSSEDVLVLKEEEKVLAFVIARIDNQTTVNFRLTAVNPLFQGKGIGTLMWNSALAHYQRLGAKQGVVIVSSHNLAVMNLWTKLGFRFIGSVANFHWVHE